MIVLGEIENLVIKNKTKNLIYLDLATVTSTVAIIIFTVVIAATTFSTIWKREDENKRKESFKIIRKVKPDEGDIHEAELSIREGLSFNYEEARALLGRLKDKKGNIEADLRVFEGIDLEAVIRFLKSLLQRGLVPVQNPSI